MKNVAVFASGSGSNAQAISEHLNRGTIGKVTCILSNNKNAFVLERAQRSGIYATTFSKDEFYNSTKIITLLNEREIDFIVLAGFLWLVPKNLIEAYPDRIINIHPALLPKYGGKGMYGMRVHESVIERGEKESGITIHYVNEKYDDGNIILQEKCQITPQDTADSLAEKIHTLEYKYFPIVVEDLLAKLP